MRVERYSSAEGEARERFFGEYASQVSRGVINPVLFGETLFPLSGPNERLLISRGPEDLILGILKYELLFPRTGVELGDFLKRNDMGMPRSLASIASGIEPTLSWEAQGFREHDYGAPLAYVKDIESFRKRVGVGRTLITLLKEQEGVAGAFLEPIESEECAGFYQDIGFRDSGLRSFGDGGKVLIWMANGKY